MSVTRAGGTRRQRFDQDKNKPIQKKVKTVTVFWDLCKWPWWLCWDSIFSSPSNFNSNHLNPVETNPIYSGKEQRCLIKIWTNSCCYSSLPPYKADWADNLAIKETWWLYKLLEFSLQRALNSFLKSLLERKTKIHLSAFVVTSWAGKLNLLKPNLKILLLPQ